MNIQQVINLNKLRFFHLFFSPTLHLFFYRIIAIDKELQLDCQSILLWVKVRKKNTENHNNIF